VLRIPIEQNIKVMMPVKKYPELNDMEQSILKGCFMQFILQLQISQIEIEL